MLLVLVFGSFGVCVFFLCVRVRMGRHTHTRTRTPLPHTPRKFEGSSKELVDEAFQLAKDSQRPWEGQPHCEPRPSTLRKCETRHRGP